MKKKLIMVILVMLVTISVAIPQYAIDNIEEARQKGKGFLVDKSLLKEHLFVAIMEKDCDVNLNLVKEEVFNEYKIATFKLSPGEVAILAKEDCIFFFGDEHSKEGLVNAFKNKLQRRERNVVVDHKSKLEEQYELPSKTEDIRQIFVTPNVLAVQEFARVYNTPKKAYEYATMKWAYVSDETLWQMSEYWMKPEDFLTKTLTMETNPTGLIASDCEEKANTFVSILRANNENARVCIGDVSKANGTGGHAWVEIWEGDRWLQLELTSVTSYNDETEEIEKEDAPSYYMFDNFLYPVVEYWVCYNEKYYVDFKEDTGNAPVSWNIRYDIGAQIDNMFSEETLMDELKYKFHKLKLWVEEIIPEDINRVGREYWYLFVGGLLLIVILRR